MEKHFRVENSLAYYTEEENLLQNLSIGLTLGQSYIIKQVSTNKSSLLLKIQ